MSTIENFFRHALRVVSNTAWCMYVCNCCQWKLKIPKQFSYITSLVSCMLWCIVSCIVSWHLYRDMYRLLRKCIVAALLLLQKNRWKITHSWQTQTYSFLGTNPKQQMAEMEFLLFAEKINVMLNLSLLYTYTNPTEKSQKWISYTSNCAFNNLAQNDNQQI